MVNTKTKKIAIIGVLCAIAYVVMVVGRIPVVMFLKYDPKDVVIAIAGFIYGPMTSFLMSLVVSLVEMVTVSETGPIGLVMNVLSTCSFACLAAFIYKRKHTLGGAVMGLAAGTALMTIVMLLWNYLLTPIYMGYPREAVVKMLIPAFLPFNLLKGGLNTALTMLLYKPIVKALRQAGLIERSVVLGANVKGKHTGVIILSVVLLVTCVFFVLVMQGIM